MTSGPATRSVDRAIDLACGPEEVWDALTTDAGLAAWFGLSARCEQGVGGRQWIKAAPDEEIEFVIDAWSPCERLRLFVPGEDGRPLPEWPLIIEYTLKPGGGGTTLRVTESGIPESDAWDVVYDSAAVGWSISLATLKHAMERHPGERRRAALFSRITTASPVNAWEALTGPALLALTEESDNVATMTLPGRGVVDVTPEVIDPPRALSVVIPELNRALLTAGLHRRGGGAFLSAALSLYGLEHATEDRIESAWLDRFDAVFPSA